MISSYIFYVSFDNVKVIKIFYLCNFVQYNEDDKSKIVKKINSSIIFKHIQIVLELLMTPHMCFICLFGQEKEKNCICHPMKKHVYFIIHMVCRIFFQHQL
jgi:hypothetical protein